MIELTFPKIETLYNRDEKTRKVETDCLRWQEFGNVRTWRITEKIDGTNVRVALHKDGTVEFGGRTNNAQMPVSLYKALVEMFPAEKLQQYFGRKDNEWPEVVLFGEGYGEKIQNGGGYRSGVSFRLFDVNIGGFWLEWQNIRYIAEELSIKTAPDLGRFEFDDLGGFTSETLDELLNSGHALTAAQDGGQGCKPEGIVAKSEPLLLTRRGERIMWKLKYRDF
jgi:ATP-dependent RNA circularization protein (DNA/RNA ligase family)